jgi:hypothetical protein
MLRWSRFALALALLAVVIITLRTAGPERGHVSFVLDLVYVQLVLET